MHAIIIDRGDYSIKFHKYGCDISKFVTLEITNKNDEFVMYISPKNLSQITKMLMKVIDDIQIYMEKYPNLYGEM